MNKTGKIDRKQRKHNKNQKGVNFTTREVQEKKNSNKVQMKQKSN